jgi:hypothetical protein
VLSIVPAIALVNYDLANPVAAPVYPVVIPAIDKVDDDLAERSTTLADTS